MSKTIVGAKLQEKIEKNSNNPQKTAYCFRWCGAAITGRAPKMSQKEPSLVWHFWVAAG